MCCWCLNEALKWKYSSLSKRYEIQYDSLVNFKFFFKMLTDHSLYVYYKLRILLIAYESNSTQYIEKYYPLLVYDNTIFMHIFYWKLYFL